MSKFCSYLVVIIIFSSSMYAHDDNVFKQQYQTVQNDLKLIKKCYLTKSPACSQNEKQAAREATLRIGAEVTGLVATVAAIGTGVWFMVKKRKSSPNNTQITRGSDRSQELPIQSEQQPEVSSGGLFAAISKIVPVESVDVYSDRVEIGLPSALKGNLSLNQKTNIFDIITEQTGIEIIQFK